MKLRGCGQQVRGGVAFAVPLLAVALRTVFEVERLARLPLRLGSDVLSRHAHRSRRRGPQRGDQDRETRARTDQTGGHCVAASSLRARPRAGVIVEKEDRIPDLVFLQELLPGGHGRVPGPSFLGKPGASLGNPPEEKRIAQQRDRFGEIGRDRVQAVDEHAGAGKVIAMAEDAVPVIDLAPVLDVLAKLFRIRLLEMPRRGPLRR